MNENKKLIAWGVLGLSLLLWILFRHEHPLVTPMLLGVTIIVLLRELGPLHFARLPFYAGALLVLVNLFITPLDDTTRAVAGGTGIALVLVAFWLGRRAARDGTKNPDENSTGNDT